MELSEALQRIEILSLMLAAREQELRAVRLDAQLAISAKDCRIAELESQAAAFSSGQAIPMLEEAA